MSPIPNVITKKSTTAKNAKYIKTELFRMGGRQNIINDNMLPKSPITKIMIVRNFGNFG